MRVSVLPRPTIELVNEACVAFDKENILAEEALSQLLAKFPHNVDSAQILLKVHLLNDLYSTRIDYVDFELLVDHIVKLGQIDWFLDQGSPLAVDLIVNCRDLRKKYFSFATKFCSWHKPTHYPIYDRNVDECLWFYNKQDKFFEYHRDYLGYETFLEIVTAFRDHYGLGSLSFKQLDKFLYSRGNAILKHNQVEVV